MKRHSNHSVNTKAWHWLWFALCAVFASLLLLCGWLIPAQLRAVEAPVLQRAGQNGLTLTDRGLRLARAGNPEAARMILQAAQREGIEETEKLASAVENHPKDGQLFPGGPNLPVATPVTTLVIRLENREAVLSYLESTGSPAVRALSRARDLTNTVIFPPSSSASGQAFDAALSVCGLLLAGDHLAPGLRDAIVERCAAARTHADAQPLEEILMDFMSLGQRLNWGQLVAFVSGINDPATLTLLAGQARNAGASLPELFAAEALSGEPVAVAAYLNDYSQTGLSDLGASLRWGEGGLDELLTSHQRLARSPAREQLMASGPLAPFLKAAADSTMRALWLALGVKWFSYLAGGFLLAAAWHHARPAVAEIEAPLRVRGFHLAHELLFALGFLLVVLLLTEPFLAQESQKAPFAFQLRLPLAGAAAAGNLPIVKTKLMDTRSLFTLLLFFVLQGLIFCVCLIKLAEIRRQKASARFRLKLLENEEHLFDAGLYLGFAGTIVCLILVSLGVIQQSLMAAYSSTSFGIIFVSIFKIFNLRPARRQLLLEVEASNPAPEQAVSAAPSLVAVE